MVSRLKTHGVWFLVILFFGGSAHGKTGSTEGGMFFLSPAFSYVGGVRQRTSSTASTEIVGSVKTGINIYDPFYLGFTYDYSEEKAESSGFSNISDNRSLKYLRSSYGPIAGVVFPGFYFFVTYFFSSELTYINADTTYKYFGGSSGAGYDATLGFKYPITENFALGAHVSYRSMIYTIQNDGSQNSSLNPTLKESKILPAISVWLEL